jgi:hypothetical protein
MEKIRIRDKHPGSAKLIIQSALFWTVAVRSRRFNTGGVKASFQDNLGIGPLIFFRP